MNIEELRDFCKKFPGVKEDIKWEHDLCFCVGKKNFCVTGFTSPLKISLKVRDEEFDELIEMNGIVPAPYVARYKCILIEDIHVLGKKKLEHYIRQSYELVKAKLPKKVLKAEGLL